MNNPVSSSQAEAQNEKNRNDANLLLLALKHKHNELRRESSRIAKSRRTLRKSKSRLAEIIASVQECERRVGLRKYLFEKRITPLNAAIEEIDEEQMTSRGMPEEEELTVEQGRRKVRDATRFIWRLERNLITEKTIEYRTNDPDTSTLVPDAASAKIEIVDVDSSGTLKQNDGLKLHDFKKCSNCEERDIDMECIFDPCGHQCFCFTCANKFFDEKKPCPACNRIPKKVVKIYLM